jgi:hypothetical protein
MYAHTVLLPPKVMHHNQTISITPESSLLSNQPLTTPSTLSGVTVLISVTTDCFCLSFIFMEIYNNYTDFCNLPFCFFFWWGWGLNLGLCVSQVGTLQLDPLLQCILLCTKQQKTNKNPKENLNVLED